MNASDDELKSTGDTEPEDSGVDESAAAPEEDASQPEEQEALPLEEVQRRAEALLFASADPLSAASIARSAGSNAATVRKALSALGAFYDQSGRAFQLREVAGAFQLLTRQEFGEVISGKKDNKPQRLSPAALEVLAIVAYEQPVMRLEVESIRGVASGPVIRTLLEKGLLKVTGRSDQIGNALLYGTTERFLEVFGLSSLKDLPEPDEAGS